MFLTKVNVSIFPIGMLVLLLISDRRSVKGTWAQRLYDLFTALVLCAVVSDVVRVGLDETALANSAPRDWVICALSVFICAGIPAFWLLYVYARIYGDEGLKRGKVKLAFMLLPAVANIAVSLTTPFADFAFFFDSRNLFSAGNGFVLVTALSILMMLSALSVSVFEAARASSLERRRVCLLLALFSFLPLIGQTADVLLHGDWLVCLLYTAQLMVLYINVQNAIITSDALTGLNNRMEFDKYLDMLSAKSESNQGFYLFIMDIDDFKSINDKYGHGSGDEALRRMADILRETFGLSNAFFARIGGDEFAMIIDTDMEATQIIAMLKAAISRSNERCNAEYELSVSVGYSMCRGGAEKPSELFVRADADMYAHKKTRGGRTS